MQTRSSDENSFRLSLWQTRDLWQNKRKICADFYTIRKIIYPSFIRRRMVGGGDPYYLKLRVKLIALEQNRRFFFYLFSPVAPQPQHLAKKSSINTNTKSITRFPIAPKMNIRTLPLSPQKWAQNAKRPFSV